MMKAGDIFVVMGVSGCGKSTMARRLAEVTGGDWKDGDDFHSPENKARMAEGIALTDKERKPWLDRLHAELQSAAARGKTFFLACSALKQTYRNRLAVGLPQVRFVYLRGSFALIHARIEQRRHHFMPATLLESQFAALEEPRNAIVLDLSRSVEQLLEDFAQQA